MHAQQYLQKCATSTNQSTLAIAISVLEVQAACDFIHFLEIFALFLLAILFLLSTGSGRHSDARREKHVLTFLHFLFPKLFHSPALPGSPLIAYHAFGRLAPLEAMHLFIYWSFERKTYT